MLSSKVSVALQSLGTADPGKRRGPPHAPFLPWRTPVHGSSMTLAYRNTTEPLPLVSVYLDGCDLARAGQQLQGRQGQQRGTNAHAAPDRASNDMTSPPLNRLAVREVHKPTLAQVPKRTPGSTAHEPRDVGRYQPLVDLVTRSQFTCRKGKLLDRYGCSS